MSKPESRKALHQMIHLAKHFFSLVLPLVLLVDDSMSFCKPTTTTTTSSSTSTSASLSSSSPSLIFPQAQHFVSKGKCNNYFDANEPPVLRVRAGEYIHVETNDCFHGKVQPSSNQSNNKDPSVVVNSLTREELNPVTGPLYIEDCMPSDWLVVKIINIIPRGIGVACCSCHSGQLSHWMKKGTTTTRFFDLSQDGTSVTMREEFEAQEGKNEKDDDNNSAKPQRGWQRRRIEPISFPTNPMLGVIGVAPATDGGKIITMPAGKHGGNLDNKCNGIGSTIYLPVNHPGALLSIGDMHASQGDGEISGTGIEIGGDVLLQCHVLKESDLHDDDADSDDNSDDNNLRPKLPQRKLQFPITETSTHWMTHGVLVENIPQTTNLACEEAAKILIGQWGYTPEEAFIFLSVKGDLGLCQSCHPDQGTQIAKMMIPKLPSCPRPFRNFDSTLL